MPPIRRKKTAAKRGIKRVVAKPDAKLLPPRSNYVLPRPVTGENLRRIVITPAERESGEISPENLQAGVEEYLMNGFVVIENAIPDSIVDGFRKQMEKDATFKEKDPNMKWNMGEGKTNFSITPPLSKRYFRREIFANDFATAIIQYVLGPRPILSWVSSNVATARGVGRQAVHSDAYTDILPLPVCVELNTYLQDITVDNGSTELWPGTQNTTEDDLVPHGRGWIKPALFNKRARTDPPIRPDLPKGTIVMRDLRLWHAGMPNFTDVPRIMVGTLYFAQWYRPLMRFSLPEEMRKVVETWDHVDATSHVDFLEGHVNHLDLYFPMNFTQDPKKELVAYRKMVDKLQGREPLGAMLPITKNEYWEPPLPREGLRSGAKGKAVYPLSWDD